MLRPLVLTAFLAAGFCGAAHADVYRWVDDHGEAHYTDRWVPGAELIKSSRPRPATPDSAAPATDAQNKNPSVTPNAGPNQKRQEKAAEDAVKQDVAKTKETQCKQAKDRYQKAIEARRIFKPAKDGNTDPVFMSDSEIDAYRLQAHNDVTVACGSPPPPVQPTE